MITALLLSFSIINTGCNLLFDQGNVQPEPAAGQSLAAHASAGAPSVDVFLSRRTDPDEAKRRPCVAGAYLSLGYWNSEEVERTMRELGMHGVNLVIDYALTPPENDTWRQAFDFYLDAASRNGIGVAFPLGPALEGMTPDNTDGYIDAATERVRQLRDEPRITAWYVHDEILPGIAGSDGTKRYALTLEQMQELYRAIHATDATRPQLAVWNSLPTYEQFQLIYKKELTPYGRAVWMDDPAAFEQAMGVMVQQTCDWVMIDSYPVGAPWRDAEAQAPELDVMSLTRRAAALKRDTQPLIFVFQGFSWAQYGADSESAAFPTRQQIDAMLCAAHVAGATGTVGYSWFDLTDLTPEKKIRGQLQALSTFKHVMTALNATGWPVVDLPEPAGAAAAAAPVSPER